MLSLAGFLIAETPVAPSGSASASATPSDPASELPLPAPSEIAQAATSSDFWMTMAKWFLGVPLQIVIIVAITVTIILTVSHLIDRAVRRFSSGEDPTTTSAVESQLPERDERRRLSVAMKARRAQRANAIGSLLRSFVTVTASGIALLTILPMLGINIAPLLTSAGVLGVALGFGAQNLIKDYLSGIYIVLEDQYGVGDVVDLNGVVGEVEEVTLRVTRLRDLSGVVWYVRNGEILKVANRSQGSTQAIVDIPVAPTTDLGIVREAVERVSRELMDDPNLMDDLLAAPEYAGVESVSGEAIVVRVVAKTSPSAQVTVMRELREKLRDAFDASGVEIPVVVRLPGQPPANPAGSATAPAPPPPR